MNKIQDVFTESNVVVDYNNKTEGGSIPVTAEVFVLNEDEERTGESATATVWIPPYEASAGMALVMAADEVGGNFYATSETALKHEDLIDILEGSFTLVVENVQVTAIVDGTTNCNALQVRALALALHAAGALHGAVILATARSVPREVLETLGFEKTGTLYHAEAALMNVATAICEGCGLGVLNVA